MPCSAPSPCGERDDSCHEKGMTKGGRPHRSAQSYGSPRPSWKCRDSTRAGLRTTGLYRQPMTIVELFQKDRHDGFALHTWAVRPRRSDRRALAPVLAYRLLTGAELAPPGRYRPGRCSVFAISRVLIARTGTRSETTLRAAGDDIPRWEWLGGNMMGYGEAVYYPHFISSLRPPRLGGDPRFRSGLHPGGGSILIRGDRGRPDTPPRLITSRLTGRIEYPWTGTPTRWDSGPDSFTWNSSKTGHFRPASSTWTCHLPLRPSRRRAAQNIWRRSCGRH